MQETYLNVKIPDECLLNLKCFWAFAKYLENALDHFPKTNHRDIYIRV